MPFFLARQICRPRAFACAAAGSLLPGRRAAIAAATDSTLQLLVASACSGEGEGQLEVVCEQPLFAVVRAVAVVPATACGAEPGQQDYLALLTDSGFLSILKYDATKARFVALQQLVLPPEQQGDPLRHLAVHQQGLAIAVASLGGTICLFHAQAAVPGDPDAAAGSGSGTSGGAGSSSSGGGSGSGPFIGPAVLSTQKHLWSLAFLEHCYDGGSGSSSSSEPATAAAAEAAAAAQGSQRLAVAVLHQHPGSRGFAAAAYAVVHSALPAAAGAVVGSGAALANKLELIAFHPLAQELYGGSGSGTEGDASNSFDGSLGVPRSLVQLPAWGPQQRATQPKAAATLLVLRERGLQLIAVPAASMAASAGELEQLRAAAQHAQQRWGLQQISASAFHGQQRQHRPGQGPSIAVQEGEERPENPSGDPTSSAAAEAAAAAAAAAVAGVAEEQEGKAEGRGAMAMSQQPSVESMEEDEEGDEEMQAAEEEQEEGAAPAAGAASESGASLASTEDVEVAAERMESNNRRFLTCCCWELPAAGLGSQRVLVCAKEDGGLWRVLLPPLGTPGGTPEWQADVALPAPATSQPAEPAAAARCLQCLPGGLLAHFTDASGVLLLRLSRTEEGGGAGYEPLLPPHLLAAQQQLGREDAGAPGCCTLPAAGALVDCTLASLEGGAEGRQQQQQQQQQLYAVCRATARGSYGVGGTGGSLCVLSQDPQPETVFELPGAAEGITGLWGLKRFPADPHHSLALLSYVGGSRLLAAQGGIFRDVTDSYALQADAQTLACANLAAPAGILPAVAQVTSQGVVLFSTAAAAASRQSSGQLGAAAGGTSSNSGSSAASPQFAWRPPAGSTIGAAAVAEEGVLAFCTGPCRQLVVLLPAPPAAAVQPGVVRGAHSGQLQEQQQQQPLLPAVPQLVEAAQMPMAAEVSCASNLLVPKRLQGNDGKRCAVFAVGTYASAVLLLQLSWHPQQPQRASLAVLRRIDLTSSSIAGSLPEAAAAAAAAAAVAGAGPFSPRSLQREQMTPESLLLVLPPARDVPAAATPAAAAEEPSLVIGLRTGSMVQLRLSLDSRQHAHQAQQAQQHEEAGEDGQLLALSLGHMPVVLLPLPPQPCSPGAAAAVAALPVAVLLSDRVSLLHCPPAGPAGSGAGRVRCQQLGLPPVQAATPLMLESGGLSSSSIMLDAADAGAGGMEPGQRAQQAQQQQTLFLLCAAADGCLRMVALDPIQLATSRCWPLPHRLQPSRVAAHPASGAVVVAGSAPAALPERLRWRQERGWEEGEGPSEVAVVQVIDPSTGEQLARFSSFLPGEAITALAVWDPFEAPPGAAAGTAVGPGTEAAASLAAAVAEAALGGEAESSEGLRSHPIALSPESPASAAVPAAAAAAGAAAPGAADEDRPWGGFIVVGTSMHPAGNSRAGKLWDDESSMQLQGRLLLLQLTTATAASASGSGRAAAAAAASGLGASAGLWEQPPPRRVLQLIPVSQTHLPSRVLAFCPGSTKLTGEPTPASTRSEGSSSSSSSSSAGSRLFASVGRRLVAYEWKHRQQLLRRVTWIPTNRPLATLQVSAGLLAASDRGEGVTLYRYYEPPSGSQLQREQQRARMARRFRLAPPGAAELRQRLGMQHALQHGPGGHAHAAARGAAPGLAGEEEAALGFAVVAADCACRPAVGAVAMPAVPATCGSGGTAQAAATLDAAGQLRLLRQRWPRHEPALHQRCSFQLRELAVALLPGSLSYQREGPSAVGSPHLGSCGVRPALAAVTAARGAGGSVPPTVAAATAAAEMVAVTASGGVLGLLPLEPQQAEQLLLLQRALALARHPDTAPLSGSSFEAFRGMGAGTSRPALFVHPPPPIVDQAAAEALAPSSPGAVPPAGRTHSGAQHAEEASGAGAAAASMAEPGAARAGEGVAADGRPGSAAQAGGPAAAAMGAAAVGAESAAPSGRGNAGASPGVQAAAPAAAEEEQEVVLDGDLLQQYLLLPPEQQQQVLAASGIAGARLGQLASKLSNLVAQLLL